MERNLIPTTYRLLINHIAIWLLVCIIPLSVPHIAIIYDLTNEHSVLQFVILQLLLYRIAMTIGVFYLHDKVLLPRFFFQQRYIPYVFCIVTLLVIVALLPHLFLSPFHHLLPPPPPQPPLFDEASHSPRGLVPPYFINPFGHVFLAICALLASFTLQINKRYQQAIQIQLGAELSWLKAQINPHFLFNTLNSIYLLSLKKSDKTSDAIIQLSEMMRYILSEANENRVPLEKEIAYINNYIAIQELRLAPTVQLHYQVTGNPLGKQIAPLILISFIENAFKYGISTTETSPIDIIIHIESNNRLQLQVSNKYFGQNKALSVGTGIGIENTQKRLNLFYPNKHQLQIKQSETDYSVLLILWW